MKMIPGDTLEERRKNLMQLMQFGSVTDISKMEIEKEMEHKNKEEKRNELLKEIDYVDNNYSYKVIKESIKEFWLKDKSLRFFINKNFHIKGKITNKIEEGIIEIPLIQKCFRMQEDGYGNRTKVIKLFMFGEKIDKGFQIEDTLSHKFHMYRFIAREEGNIQTFMVITEEVLELEEYDVEGMMLDLDDFSEVSKYTKILKKSHIVFANKLIPSKKTYSSHEDFIEDIKSLELNEDKFFKNLLSVSLGSKKVYFQHPRYFERLIGSFFLSGKHDSSPYPMHLLVIGKQGGGKSKIMEALYEHVDETVPIIEGSGSTMKSLIPSFRGELTKPGALIETNRIGFVDEFFRILMRIDKDDRQDTLTHLNPLLEHKKRRFGSGNNFLDAKMTSKLFSVTNPVFGTSNMDSLAHKMDNSFLSRILIWYQDEEHYKEITSKTEGELEEIGNDISIQDWKAIFDYCYSFKSEFNREIYLKIYNECKNEIISIRQEAQDIYSSRYKHHLACLLDGIIKLRCICESDPSFKAKKEDYDKCKEIWSKMLVGWKKGIENIRFEVREGRFYT